MRKIPWRRDRLPTPVFLDFPGSSDCEEPASNVGEVGSIPGLRRSPGGGDAVSSPWTRSVNLSLPSQHPSRPPLRGNHKFVFYFCDSISPLKISIVTTAGLLPGESPWREEPGGLESMRSQRIGHDSATKQRSTAQSVSLTLELLGTYMLNCCHLLLLVQE